MAAVTHLEPSFNVSTVWDVRRIRAALMNHELGDFGESARLAEFIRRDPIVFQALDSRVLGMLGLPFGLDPSDEGDQRKTAKVAADVRLWWRKRIRKSQLAKIVRWGILMGFCPGTLRWDEDDKIGKLLPRPRVYHPQWARYVSNPYGTQRRGFTLQTSKETVNLETGTGDFFLFAPGGDDQPWMEGAIRALAIPVLIRSFAERDWARASEVYGMGVRKVKVPDDATKQPAIAAFLRDIRNLANEPTIKVPDGFDFSVEIVDASDGRGFEALMNKCEAAIIAVILGQVLTSQSSSGGSYALAKEAARSTLDRFEADVENLGDFVENDILAPYCERNEGDPDLAPRPYWDTDPPEDKAVLAARMMNMATAVRTMKDAGIPVDVRALCESIEIPLLPATPTEATRRGQLRDAHYKLKVLRRNDVRDDLGLPRLSKEEGGEELLGEGAGSLPDAPDVIHSFPPANGAPPPPPVPATPNAKPENEATPKPTGDKPPTTP